MVLVLGDVELCLYTAIHRRLQARDDFAAVGHHRDARRFLAHPCGDEHTDRRLAALRATTKRRASSSSERSFHQIEGLNAR